MYVLRIFFIAVFLVQAFSPQSFPMQNPGLMSPFVFPLSPNIPPYNLSPAHHPQHNTPSPRHNISKKRDNDHKASHVSQDKNSTKASSAAESSSSTKAHSPSVKTQNPFIPLQVCTLILEVDLHRPGGLQACTFAAFSPPALERWLHEWFRVFINISN